MNNSLAYKEDIWEELINGQTVLVSPRPTWSHISTAANIFYIFRKFLFGRKCTPIPDGMEVYLDEKNRFIPDMMVVCDPEKNSPERRLWRSGFGGRGTLPQHHEAR